MLRRPVRALAEATIRQARRLVARITAHGLARIALRLRLRLGVPMHIWVGVAARRRGPRRRVHLHTEALRARHGCSHWGVQVRRQARALVVVSPKAGKGVGKGFIVDGVLVFGDGCRAA